MAKFRETPCLYYIAKGQCSKEREASHSGYCQHCDKYKPREKIKHLNKKKDYIRKEKGEY